MKRNSQPPCAGCQRLQAQLEVLRAEVQSLRATVAQLQERLAQANKDCSTSSKPPCSDLVKPPPPPPPEGQAKRSSGGQPGQARHERALLPEAMVNGGVHRPVPEIGPDCGQGLQALNLAGRVVQQIDREDIPLRVEEHRSLAGWCRHGNTIHYGALPSGIDKGGLVGPRLTTLIAYLKGACHASYSTIGTFLRDLVGVTIARGQLAKVSHKVSQALDVPYQALLENLPQQTPLNVDETGHPEHGEKWWTWCFRASLYTVFKIDPTRSGDVLLEVLGKEFEGVLGCD